jgi:hypothetical protein
MRFAFVRSPQYSEWGGDLKAIQDLQEGLHLLGHASQIVHEPGSALSADYIFFIGTLLDQSSNFHFMQLAHRNYGCIAFHEDHLLYSGASFGFPYYISNILQQTLEENVSFSLKDLYERPHLIFYYDRMRPVNVLQNYEFLKKATSLIVSSPTEQKTLLRDVPGSSPHIVLWGAGHARELVQKPTEDFLSFTGLANGSYILQVGRMSSRKNQLATLLATKDLDIPLIFIAMNRCTPAYEQLFFAAAAQWRKAPTFLISQHLPASQGPVTVIPTPDGKILSSSLLLSAFAHAGLHMHPAFYELPGYTYFESARFGVPTIASEWTSLKDYFTDASGRYTLDDRIEYALPYDLPALTALAKKKFGQKYPQFPLHPIYERTAKDIAHDFLNFSCAF